MKSSCQGDVGFGLGKASERFGGQIGIQKTMVADLARELEAIVEIVRELDGLTVYRISPRNAPIDMRAGFGAKI
jgi:hypothetical protein